MLGYCLQLTLAHRDYPRALKIITAMYSCTNAPAQHIWPSSVFAFRKTQGTSEALDFLKSHVTQYSCNSVEILQEVLMYHIRLGTLDKAYELVTRYLHSEPFRQNAIIHGYAGMMALALDDDRVKHANETNRLAQELKDTALSTEADGIAEHESDNKDDIFRDLWYSPTPMSTGDSNTNSLDHSQSDSWVAKAINHFCQSQALSPTLDLFLPFYVQTLVRSRKFIDAKYVAVQFCHYNPFNPAGYRVALSLLNADLVLERRAWVELAKKYVTLDPVCDLQQVIFPLCTHYEHLIGMGYTEHLTDVIELLARRIEFTRGCETATFRRLADIYYRTIPAYWDRLQQQVYSKLWESRLPWWDKFIFDDPTLTDYSDSQVTLRHLLMHICAAYIFPAHYKTFGIHRITSVKLCSEKRQILDQYLSSHYLNVIAPSKDKSGQTDGKMKSNT
ncbi:hypothetical protein IWQ62_001375 [Dispira parvispora]|uniref:Uncharacterized protein n=1 Tax=Dispira parvispora TaxID=1520584 RepID=A0A9W8AY06_9FUNG|nr:hypothetical protein IWQ62_001375 [Dispira parvispora]